MNASAIKRSNSVVYNGLLWSFRYARKLRLSGMWHNIWNWSINRFKGATATRLHGYDVVLNFGNTYPLNSRLYPTYNNPLVELVNQACKSKGGPVKFVDVGAATGDTILLLFSNSPDMISEFCCVDGDEEFSVYLKHNLGRFTGGKLVTALLSSEASEIHQLVRIHGGTASAQGESMIPCVTLDALLCDVEFADVDVIKIDVDGFDGMVLMGARRILKHDRPAVIFEWHPILCEQTGNNWSDAIDALTECGYDRLLWFNKFGRFSHFSDCVVDTTTREMADLCIRNRYDDDWHYDIIALHASSKISPVDLAETEYANRKRSCY